jgi:glycosyltransferase involved in cell wall biosynthesis
MKLLFAHDHIFYKYNNEYYSLGGFSKQILERYSAVFDEVIVVSRQKLIDDFSEKLTLASAKNVRFVEVPNFKSLKTLRRYYEAKAIVEKEILKVDRVIARLPSSIGSIAVDLSNKLCKQYLIELVACPWDEYWNHSFIGKLLAPYNYLSTKSKVRNSLYTVYVTNNFLQKRYPTNGKSTNCSNVVLTEFTDNILKDRLKKIKSMQSIDKVVIGTTAAVDVRYKGQQYVIEAIGRLRKEDITNIEYQLVGGGDQTYLKVLAEKHKVEKQVKFLGAMPHKRVFEWLETIDIYVQPSRQEGLPRALIEAMSRGLPAFGAKTGGIPELLESEFLFSNTRNNINEICKILGLFRKEVMLEQAKRNYKESQKYDKEYIEITRRQFLSDFKSCKN